jgi:RNA 3'-terminal phosphate cyclase
MLPRRVQGALPCMLLAGPPLSVSTVTLTGGTDVAFSPPLDFLTHVLLPTLRRMLPQGVEAR